MSNVTVKLTSAEAEALWHAAARGSDEWEFELDYNPGGFITREIFDFAEEARKKLYRAMNK